MSRVSDKHKESLADKSDTTDSDISDDDEDIEGADREETPDLYRNSSLGMYVEVNNSYQPITDSYV